MKLQPTKGRARRALSVFFAKDELLAFLHYLNFARL